jgi:hypothetical protein
MSNKAMGDLRLEAPLTKPGTNSDAKRARRAAYLIHGFAARTPNY